MSAEAEAKQVADQIQHLARDGMIYLMDMLKMRDMRHPEFVVLATSLMMTTGVHALKASGPIPPAMTKLLRDQIAVCLDQLK